MCPPPPPLGRSRKRSAHAFDAALDDTELTAARSALAGGRWSAVRSLLAATGDDWDRRGHRLHVLAQEPGTAAWAGDWRLAEPDSVDAAVLLAFATVHRALADKARPEAARDACHEAAGLAPSDPSPWLALLVLERAIGREEDVVRLFDEVRHRYPEHHHAHHLMVARLAERHPETGQDPLHEVYDFASWAAEQAPADSPLAILPVVAHAERYRVLATAGSEPSDPAASGHWLGRRARLVMKAAFDWWLEWEREDHPRNRVDLNFLAHAKFCEGRPAEAAALFQRIGPHATGAPWSYPDRDPYEAFHAARRAALGTT
ncbi:hypothetical protein [Streptomyces odontomachi]|uniref:hypothetical protein n=1 Tax=Streptomyces odontomachi TaxID=2944940 RepID=UPI00210B0AA4|nr:hypothetical protein [Streptomyces sp. ODS25]